MLSRVLYALLAGVITWLASFIVIALVSALLPGLTIDAAFWAGVVAIIVALLVFLNPDRFKRV